MPRPHALNFSGWMPGEQPVWHVAVPAFQRPMLGRAERQQDAIARHPMLLVRAAPGAGLTAARAA
jgi:hypothetical protein